MNVEFIKEKTIAESSIKPQFGSTKSIINQSLQLWNAIQDSSGLCQLLYCIIKYSHYPLRTLRRFICSANPTDKIADALAIDYFPAKNQFWALNDCLVSKILSYITSKQWLGLNASHSLLNINKTGASYILPNQYMYQQAIMKMKVAADRDPQNLGFIKSPIVILDSIISGVGICESIRRIMFDGTILLPQQLLIFGIICDYADLRLAEDSGVAPDIMVHDTSPKNVSCKPDLSTLIPNIWWTGLIYGIATNLSLNDFISLAKVSKYFYYHMFTAACIRACLALRFDRLNSQAAKSWSKFSKNRGPMYDIIWWRYLLSGIQSLHINYDWLTEGFLSIPKFDSRNLIVYSGAVCKLDAIGHPLKIVEFVYDKYFHEQATFEHLGWGIFRNANYSVALYIVSNLINTNNNTRLKYPRLPKFKILFFNNSVCNYDCLWDAIYWRNTSIFYFNKCRFSTGIASGSVMIDFFHSGRPISDNKEIYLIDTTDFAGIAMILNVHHLYYKYVSVLKWKLQGDLITLGFGEIFQHLINLPDSSTPKDISIILTYTYPCDYSQYTQDKEAPSETLWTILYNFYDIYSTNVFIKTLQIIFLQYTAANDDSGYVIDLKSIVKKDDISDEHTKWIRHVLRYSAADISDSTVAKKEWQLFFQPLNKFLW